MRKFLQVMVVGGAALLLLCFGVAPILVYIFGVPWLPSLPRASESQLALFYTIYAPLIGGVAWLLNLVYKWWLRGRSSTSSLSKPGVQPVRLAQTQTMQAAYHDDPIIIGGGREKNYWLFGYLLFVAYVIFVVGSLTASQDKTGISVIVVVAVTAIFIIIAINSRKYGKRRECLQIGSEGIEYSIAKVRMFIPWDEIVDVYMEKPGRLYFEEVLFVKLRNNSRLLFQEPIKSRYKNGAINICRVPTASISIIPKHLVENALDIYAP